MKREDLLARISVDPNICFGKPCIKGHRIWVSLVLDFLASGWTVQDILSNYPGLEKEDVLACIAYGAEMARERCVDIPIEKASCKKICSPRRKDRHMRRCLARQEMSMDRMLLW